MLMLAVPPFLLLLIHVIHLHVVWRPSVNWTMETQSVPVQEAKLAILLSDVSLMDPSVLAINVDPTLAAG